MINKDESNTTYEKKKYVNFEDTGVWKDSINLAVEIYNLTKSFPKDEMFGITSQIRRAVTSISANLAEGFGRHGKKEKAQFYSIAYGSLLETKSFLYLAQKLGYTNDILSILPIIESLQRQINAIKRSLNSNV